MSISMVAAILFPMVQPGNGNFLGNFVQNSVPGRTSE